VTRHQAALEVEIRRAKPLWVALQGDTAG
jgi:hypothetical protein